jgi:hypothetical protein
MDFNIWFTRHILLDLVINDPWSTVLNLSNSRLLQNQTQSLMHIFRMCLLMFLDKAWENAGKRESKDVYEGCCNPPKSGRNEGCSRCTLWGTGCKSQTTCRPDSSKWRILDFPRLLHVLLGTIATTYILLYHLPRSIFFKSFYMEPCINWPPLQYETFID